MLRTPESAPARPLIIGHRGASGYRPEHSESAYRLAFELGAEFVEPDIVATSDGVLVVRHENEISGTTDVADHEEFRDRRTTKTVDGQSLTGWFTEDFTWDELSTLRTRERLPKLRPDSAKHDGEEPILRLSDVLGIIDEESERAGREFGVVIEIKHAAYFQAAGLDLVPILIRELLRSGWNERPARLVIESFELGALDRVRESGLRGKLVFLAERIGAPADEPIGDDPKRSYGWYRSDDGLDLLAGRVHGISVAKGDLLRLDALGNAVGPTTLVERAHARGLSVYTWTLRPENRFLNLGFRSSLSPSEWGDWSGEFGMIVESGVDGIFVDHPDLGAQIVAPGFSA
ncbi:glycerophosphodiester phosphodiesterase [Leucobacter sp. CSA2]|uniref:glycerophosphodiester phosphodiesterase n=1 Tax=Leucobacter edaphi TaxID=2796472 RepID=A0A934QBD0_9MICO|nr:glycerophosphodiester phosphodiesterase family protein [Leucobacter edaphi]MBK0420730.1 glycerophosphodiester phosphodiesterase [Leucobacter edaphi]